MGGFLDLTEDKAVLGDISFFNFQNTYIADFGDEVTSLIGKSLLIIVAVDGAVDKHLVKALEERDMHYELCKDVCVLWPDSVVDFLSLVRTIPGVAFHCCKEMPKEDAINAVTQGYVEEFGKISGKPEILSIISQKMLMLDSFLYISQGQCNLFLGVRD